MTRPDITRARKTALQALVVGWRHQPDGVVRVSNKTSVAQDRPSVYWQAADWLVLNGLAHSPGDYTSGWIALTVDRGVPAAVELGLLEPEEVAP